MKRGIQVAAPVLARSAGHAVAKAAGWQGTQRARPDRVKGATHMEYSAQRQQVA